MNTIRDVLVDFKHVLVEMQLMEVKKRTILKHHASWSNHPHLHRRSNGLSDQIVDYNDINSFTPFKKTNSQKEYKGIPNTGSELPMQYLASDPNVQYREDYTA